MSLLTEQWEVRYGSYNNERNHLSSSGIAGAEEIRTAFIENNQALTWLAEFLTGDEMIAAACVIDACNLSTRRRQLRSVSD